jgi:teichuronopeptide biosynthesis TupA-like protein
MSKIKQVFRRLCLGTSRRLERIGLVLKETRLADYALGRWLIDVVLWPSDLWKVCSSYKRSFGRMPRLLKPQTFNEKRQYAKLFRREKYYTQFADKIAVRDFVAKKVGSQYLTKILWVGSDLRSAKEVSLPDSFVVKANHGSGMNIIVKDIRQFDWESAHQQTQEWLKQNYAIHSAEWEYRWIPPKLFIEEYLKGENGDVAFDYKFFCFQGRVELLQVDFDRFAAHTRSFHDRNFILLSVGCIHPRPSYSIKEPNCYAEMLRIVETLASDESFVRVDLYEIGRPIFGELTLHPAAGVMEFTPREWDLRLGQLMS